MSKDNNTYTKYMSQKQYQKNIEKELARINSIIDLKILQGQSYFNEAKKHKTLVRSLNAFSARNTSFIGRFNSSLSF